VKLWLTHPLLAVCGIINLVNEHFMFASNEVQGMLDARAIHSSYTLIQRSCLFESGCLGGSAVRC